jgi:hypothetical protein
MGGAIGCLSTSGTNVQVTATAAAQSEATCEAGCEAEPYGLTIKTAAAYWVISSKPIARQADLLVAG